MRLLNFLSEAPKPLMIVTRIDQISGNQYFIKFKHPGDQYDSELRVDSLPKLLETLKGWNVPIKDIPFGRMPGTLIKDIPYGNMGGGNDIPLQYYLSNIDDDGKKVKELLLKNCKPILKELKGHNGLLYRGSARTINVIGEVVPRMDRRPLMSNAQLSDAVDDALYKKFKWRPRSEGVFSYYKDDAGYSTYGKGYFFMPIGEYKYVWSKKYEDLYLYLAPRDFKLTDTYIAQSWLRNITRGDMEPIYKTLKVQASKVSSFYGRVEINPRIGMDKLIKVGAKYAADTYIDNDMTESKRSELSFKCNSYYLIEREYERVLLDLIS